MEWIKVKKKPVVVEAFQLTEDMLPIRDDTKFKPHKDEKGRISICHNYADNFDNKNGIYAMIYKDSIEIFVETLEGDMKAKVSDYIIRGVEGEIYPCRKDIFEKTYDILERK